MISKNPNVSLSNSTLLCAVVSLFNTIEVNDNINLSIEIEREWEMKNQISFIPFILYPFNNSKFKK